jgi:Transglutaminase-like superfamily
MTEKYNNTPVPNRYASHFLWLAFFFCAAGAALWQHGNPMFSLILLGAIFPVGLLAYLPERLWNDWPKVILQVTAAFGACAWGAYRINNGVPPDKVLAESISLFGFCFIFARGRGDYQYLLLISIILLLYGSLIPRAIYLFFGGGALLLLPVILYMTRTQALFTKANLRKPQRFVRRNWPQIFLHFGIFLCFTYYFFMLLPNRGEGREGAGLIVVSFKNENKNLAPNFNRWIKSAKTKTKTSPTGKKVRSGTDNPKVLDKKGPKVSVKNNPSMAADGQGGSGMPGKELIFRVKSPAKLYWLAQLYDDYDGIKWYTSDYLLKKARINHTRAFMLNYFSAHVEQEFIIEKWFSKKLYSAFHKVSMSSINTGQSQLIKQNYYGGEIVARTDDMPPLPFAYTVKSKLYQPHDVNKAAKREVGTRKKRKVKLTYFLDNTSIWHYMKLPRGKVSRRLRKLALDLTKGEKDPYKKAMILRNYLRKNYGYKQRSKPLPEGKESADYFIFELKEGHCEYFAAALAMLARINRLPARVATGFSPGNYNVITGLFEVHEYHAHAWTQIFIEGMGWLTFDAAPPGAVESRTTPLTFASLRDPFGDSWRVRPPELTDETQDVIRKQMIKQMERMGGERDTSKKDQILIKTVELQDKIRDKFNEIFGKKEEDENKKNKKRSLYEEFKYRLKNIYIRLRGGFFETLRLLRKYWPAAVALALIFWALKIQLGIFIYYIRRKLLLNKCRGKFRQAEQIVEQAPGKAVLLSYQAARALLVVSDLPRIRNLELHEYCVILNKIDYELSRSMLVVCFFFSKLEYSTEPIPPDEAKITLEHAMRVRDFVAKNINEQI